MSSSQISVPRVYQGTSLTMPLLGAGKPDQVDKEDKLKVDKGMLYNYRVAFLMFG